ncbi:MAG: hypothetical protein E5X48_29415 [Mesorhizobium sp.]|uniref:hypothetical protein n=1 Tax=Mesorhizobium sp. TaxID=1871066 RepID=UPI00120A4A35|nr:hypothetical protein [Mesorhizobium sp.]TIQ29958.1 MAG: hypothetical protein E5X48_29415 [Mesorhizobium sp.]
MSKEPYDTAAFISELIRAANETDQLTKLQRARLLQRAAVTLRRDYQCKVDYSGTPANIKWLGHVIYSWPEMPRLIDMFSDEEVSNELLYAAWLFKQEIAAIEAGKPKVLPAKTKR